MILKTEKGNNNMKKKTKVIITSLLVVVSLSAVITIKTINNFNNKKEIAKQNEIVRIENENKVEEINSILDKIDTDDLTIKDKSEIDKLYKDYNNLGIRYKKLVDEKKLNSVYQQMKKLEMEDSTTNSDEQTDKLKTIEKEISKLPALDNLTLDDALSVNLLIQQYNELTEENKKKIDYKKLEEYKNKLNELINK